MSFYRLTLLTAVLSLAASSSALGSQRSMAATQVLTIDQIRQAFAKNGAAPRPGMIQGTDRGQPSIEHRMFEPALPESLPFVDSIRFLPKAAGGRPEERPICPGDSVVMLVTGHFPTDCFEFVEMSQVVFIREGPPTIYIVVSDNTTCHGGPCIETVIIPWRASLTLAPFSAPAHIQVDVWLQKMICHVPQPPDTALQISVPLLVDSCVVPPPPTGCLRASMHDGPPDHCDATVAKNDPAEVTLRIASRVALAGLQGSLRCTDGLRISHLNPIGPAAGMHLSWTPTAAGADFVLFADHGAPIPPTPPNSGLIAGAPVLRVTVELTVRRPPELGLVTPERLLGSDALGNGVPECPRPAVAIDLISARICSERGCDFNGDGVVDVRDLVLMAHCITAEIPCPAIVGFDCNQDSTLDIDDVLCCAGRILGRDPCLDCPRDSTRHERDIRLSFGTPVRTPDGLDLPLRLEGTHLIGGARLGLRYPADRYEVASVELMRRADWLELHQVRDDRAIVGLIQLGNVPIPAVMSLEPLELVLHLRLKSGASHGGAVTASDFEFSGPDGVMLDVDLGTPSQALSGPLLALSRSQPNPFASETRFALTLEQSADVDVGIYDLGGRRVASIFHGPLVAGTRSFAWSGRDAAGSTVPNGIYFYRATSGGHAVARKLILLRKD